MALDIKPAKKGLYAIIVDLDGTLADDISRRIHLQNRDYDAYHATIMLDPVHEDVYTLVQAMCDSGYLIIACTARPEKHRIVTERWLIHHKIPVDEVLMRDDLDFRPDAEVKIDAITKYFGTLDNAKDNIRFVLDDRDVVVKAWREAGFSCFQVREGDGR